jgi:hypothetical protein
MGDVDITFLVSMNEGVQRFKISEQALGLIVCRCEINGSTRVIRFPEFVRHRLSVIEGNSMKALSLKAGSAQIQREPISNIGVKQRKQLYIQTQPNAETILELR